MDLELVSATRQAGSTPSVHSFAPDVDDSGASAPIRISSDLVGTGFEAVRTIMYQSHLPEYPKTDNAGFGYCINVGHLPCDDVLQLHKQVQSCKSILQKLSGY